MGQWQELFADAPQQELNRCAELYRMSHKPLEDTPTRLNGAKLKLMLENHTYVSGGTERSGLRVFAWRNARGIQAAIILYRTIARKPACTSTHAGAKPTRHWWNASLCASSDDHIATVMSKCISLQQNEVASDEKMVALQEPWGNDQFSHRCMNKIDSDPRFVLQVESEEPAISPCNAWRRLGDENGMLRFVTIKLR